MKLKKILPPVLALMVIGVLIYLPQIIGVKKIAPGSFEKNEKKQKNVSLAKEEPQPSQVEQQEKSETKRVRREGLGPKISRHLVKSASKDNRRGFIARNRIPNNKVKAKIAAEKAAAKKINPIELNDWSYVSGPVIQTKLNNILKKVNKVNSQLDSKYTLTRKVLGDFVDQLSLLVVDTNQQTNISNKLPRDTLTEVEKLDLRVLTRMLQEDAPRSLLLEWYDIDLSTFYNSGRVQGFKALAISNFNPRLQIHEIVYYLHQDSWQAIPAEIARMQVSFVLLKDSIKSIKLFKDNIFQKELIKSVDFLTGEWSFVVAEINDLNSIYMIEVTDNADTKFSKQYSFLRPFGRLSTELIINTADDTSVRTAHLRDNFKDNINVLDAHYSYIDPLQKQLNAEFPSGTYERF